jgi:DNA-binding response OmpR family regulator
MSTRCCAACGRPLDLFDAAEAALRLRLSPKETKLLTTLGKRPGRVTLYREILHALYGDDPGGGPDHASSCMRRFAIDINKRLAAEGYRIRTVWGQGYTLERMGETA